MLFNSREFLIFFPIVSGLFFLLPVRFRWCLLLLASYVFYMWKRPEDITFMILITASSYIGALAVSRAPKPTMRRTYLLLDVCFCLSLLSYYKYSAFLATNANLLIDAVGLTLKLPVVQHALPIGLSFYTFMAISYSVDVYRREQIAEQHLGIHALFLSFYPHLVAGPIMRSEELRPQFLQQQFFENERAADGLRLMLWGLFKKMVIADGLAAPVTQIYSNPTAYSGLPLLLATLFFAVQIYCDFSGYCDIALGAARFMGFKLPVNFDKPYGSLSVGEFWRRWHITLGTWFRDYVYIPLGGNKRGAHWHYLNIIIVFLLSGLWHGANWTFVIWGCVHGAAIVTERISANFRHRLIAATVGSLNTNVLSTTLGRAWTISIVVFAWIFFRAQTFDQAIYVVTHTFYGLTGELLNPLAWAKAAADMKLSHGQLIWFGLLTASVFFGHIFGTPGQIPRAINFNSRLLRHAAYATLVCLILFAGNPQEVEFIYFQF